MENAIILYAKQKSIHVTIVGSIFKVVHEDTEKGSDKLHEESELVPVVVLEGQLKEKHNGVK